MKEEILKKQNNDRFMNAYEVSACLCLPLSTVYDLTKNGRIKAVRAGKRLRYKKDDIEYYLKYGIPASSRYPVYRPPPAAGTEKRENPRINCSLSCHIYVNIQDEKKISAAGRISNIGQGGAFIKNHRVKDIRTDDPINIRFELNENTGLEAEGRVLRTEDKGIAVKFKKLNPLVRELITEYVG